MQIANDCGAYSMRASYIFTYLCQMCVVLNIFLYGRYIYMIHTKRSIFHYVAIISQWLKVRDIVSYKLSLFTFLEILNTNNIIL